MILLIEEGYIQDINSYSLGERDKSLKFHQKVNQYTLYLLENFEVNDLFFPGKLTNLPTSIDPEQPQIHCNVILMFLLAPIF